MTTVLNRYSPKKMNSTKTATQKISTGVGILLMLLSFIGIVSPGMLGMHLSPVHNIIHLASGLLGVWSGHTYNPRSSYHYCLSFGVFYGIVGLGGFVFGEPGYPTFGYMKADNYLLRVIPNAFELGTNDHIFHIMVTTSLLMSALIRKKNKQETIYKTNEKLGAFEVTDNAKVQHREIRTRMKHMDLNRRSDIERRI